MKYKKTAPINELENEIESGLVTAHEYSDPEIFLPMNPIFRFTKKIFLFLIRMYTKYQIVFNYNILFSINKIYQFILKLRSDRDEMETKYKKLEIRVRQLEKKLKDVK